MSFYEKGFCLWLNSPNFPTIWYLRNNIQCTHAGAVQHMLHISMLIDMNFLHIAMHVAIKKVC